MADIIGIGVKKFPINLAQFLKWSGSVLTGGEAKELIRSGQVMLNGSVCQTPGQHLQAGDIITFSDIDYIVTFNGE